MIGHFKWCLMSDPRRNKEDTDAEGDVNYGSLSQEVSERRYISV